MNSAERDGYKVTLLEMRHRLTREVNSAIEALRQDVVAPGDITSVPTHPADDDAEGLDSQVAIAQNERNLLEMVDEALERIEAGTFGKCVDCDREIDRARLDAIPYTPWCIRDAANHEQQLEPPSGPPRQT